ncbi:PadR family transcriptional regulator [Clostridium butyricum]|uniref:Transcriptional regulator, PadR family n=1 Tax=Clostridium butyricum E4 str. BoNT E BL5262 TaxID=632245 RepID=C4IMK0_CLOBU|nr:PadR family transcriptional regulator [Clostridium butyricum]APF22953.1 transcriptional regulator PadR-like family protein [Clostridium butyricum]EDT73644.1 transcriptional regulator, PadR family [Clostridium butyricum 5521]EEP52559.1 transcriptional regulator, PadR family [Clostridium butyricum E4 str. BoNT E BL5262]NFL33174.1 PadR family transcriptional regulator [Clostridium butyricum]NFS20097.1 PadR family transcriptional regulator [Clostridium butyricum]
MSELGASKNDYIKSEEKRLYEEYKKKISDLKKESKKPKESSVQIFTKGLLPIYVLYLLSLSPTNGNEISHSISIKTNGKWTPSTGGIYPLLKRMEEDDLIIGEWDNPNKRFQKIYKITEKGLHELENKKIILKSKIEDSLEVFKIIYNDLYF